MIKFGTSGFRAIIGDGFTKENIQKVAQSLAKKIKQEKNLSSSSSYSSIKLLKSIIFN